MTRWFAFFLTLLTQGIVLIAADQLPKSDSDEPFEIEPPLLIPNRDAEKSSAANANATLAPAVDPEKLEKDLGRAKRNATGAERLFKIGAISKVDAEQRALRVVRLQADLENARLTLAKQEMMQQQTRVAAGELSKTELSDAERDLARAIEAAHSAAARREQAEIDAAEINLRRQQKLLALGSARKSDVNRAEQKLAELRTPKE